MNHRDHFWKQIPFLRILIPFCTGIIFGFYSDFTFSRFTFLFLAIPVVAIAYHFLLRHHQYRLRFIPGILIYLSFFSIGVHALNIEDVRNYNKWFGHNMVDTASFHAVLNEPPQMRARTYKAIARISVIEGNNSIPKNGKLLIYFEKSRTITELDYGSQIVFLKRPERIRSSGNPYAFDYARYCLFQRITHQVFLKTSEYIIVPGKKTDCLNEFIFRSKLHVLNIIKKYVPGIIEAGVAEALLLGYKNDLDKSLVTSYSNTGVVHIIAISGLHLGLIYWLLNLFLTPLAIFRQTKWLRSLIIIACLWIFTLLAGAQPSILRSAVMFTCIVLGESISRKTNVYNTLAVSAFILLCINPYWLWDAGFQLSYAAVLSIIIFMKPVYNLYYTENKLLDLCWKMNAVTISAQILTIPICLYHFHQFPILFLLTNFVAVPLSSIILLAEIGLCAVSFFSPLANILGNAVSWMIGIMNAFVVRTEAIPFSSWKHLQITAPQAILLYLLIVFSSVVLTRKYKKAFYPAIVALFLFALIRNISFNVAYQQKKILIYNIPGKTAIDFIAGRKCCYLGDSSIIEDYQSRAFHIDPARTAFRVSETASMNDLYWENGFVDFFGVKMMVLVNQVKTIRSTPKHHVDLLLLNGKRIYSLLKLAGSISPKLIVLGPAMSPGSRQALKNECTLLNIPFYDIQEKGAFVMNLR